MFSGMVALQFQLQICLLSGKTIKIYTVFLKRKTKKWWTEKLTENMKLKVKSPRYFPGLFTLSFHKKEVSTKKISQFFQLYWITNYKITNSAGKFLRFPFTNFTHEILQWDCIFKF